MRYPEYIRQTTAEERQLYALYLALKAEKEKHAMDVAEAQAELERNMARNMGNGYRA